MSGNVNGIYLNKTLQAVVAKSTSSPIRWWVVNMTPELARRLLDDPECSPAVHGITNRKSVPSRVESYAETMRAGEWAVNAEPIVFSNRGARLNGEHRLRAVVAAGVSVPMCVVVGVDHEAFHTFDQGRNRSQGDVAAIAGYTSTLALAALVNQIARYENGQMEYRQSLVSNREMLDYIQLHHGKLQEAISFSGHVRQVYNFRGMNGASVGAMWHLTRQSGHDELTADFWTKLTTGAGLETSDTIYRFRRVLDGFRQSKSKPTTAHVNALAIKAYNAHVLGKPLTMFRFGDDEPYPQIVGRPPRGTLSDGDAR